MKVYVEFNLSEGDMVSILGQKFMVHKTIPPQEVVLIPQETSEPVRINWVTFVKKFIKTY